MYTGNYTNYRAQLASRPEYTEVQAEIRYVVEKKFTDWSNGRRYLPGEVVEISENEFNNFRWALETGRLVLLNKKDADNRSSQKKVYS